MDLLEVQLESWMLDLAHIPDDKLMPSYELAIRNHVDGPFGVHEICRAFEALNLKQPGECCEDPAAMMRAISEFNEFEALGERMFSSLSAEEQDLLVKVKIRELLSSANAEKFKQMPDDSFSEYAIRQVKADLAKSELHRRKTDFRVASGE